MRVLHVASEIFPLVKTGGLADVVGALPAALAGLGVEVRVLVPGYPAVVEGLASTRQVAWVPELLGGPARLLQGRTGGGTEVVAIDAPHLYDRPGSPYLGPDRRDWPDNHLRFGALGLVAAMIGRGQGGWRPDVVHAHDWQAGLAPVYLALEPSHRPATVQTIHNLAYQGLFAADTLAALRLPQAAFGIDGVEFHGRVGFLKGGLAFADRITTVSPTYAREIRTPELGMGLDGLLRARADRITGILNGIDTDVWNPAADPHLVARYDAGDLEGKAANRAALEARFGLDGAGPLLAVISRLVPEKGLDLVLEAVPALVAMGARLVLLGSGDPLLEEGFRAQSTLHRGRIGVVIGHDEGLAHLIQGAADAILVPSRIEPCGLTQLCGLRYGTLPIVGRVGGLADSVIDANEAALADGVATGFQLTPVTLEALVEAIGRAAALFRDRDRWHRVVRRAMTREVGWSRAAERYLEVYRELLADASTDRGL
jgi:starch synthase